MAKPKSKPSQPTTPIGERLALVAGNARLLARLAEAMGDIAAEGAVAGERLDEWSRILAGEAAHLRESIDRV